jgi:hypothetical protein
MKTKEEISEYHKKYREQNKEKLYLQKKTYREENREACNARKRKWNKANREHVNELARALYAKDPQKQVDRSKKYKDSHPGVDRNSQLKRWYGITLDEYNVLLDSQNGKCAICGIDKPMGVGCFHVDHDHITNKVRGLLCQKCNMGIGALQDSPTILRKAAEYLESRNKELIGE